MSVRAYYQGKRVLVTGLTGFKGVWLGLWLQKLGAKVVGLSLRPSQEMQLGWPSFDTQLRSHHADVRDLPTVQSLVKTVAPDLIFHLAAQPLVRFSYEDPVGTYATNVMGTAHVLEAARQTSSVQAVVVITTDKCYENREWHWGYREVDPLGGHDPYSSSKACAEILAASYRSAFPASLACRRLATARAGNVIGGGDWAENRLVPDMVRALNSHGEITLRSPSAYRPWQHVLEPLSGYLLLGAALTSEVPGAASAWNFGPADGEPLTVGEIARRFVKSWGSGNVRETVPASGPHEAQLLKLDSSKATANLGWKSLLNGDERLDWTVEWYKHWQKDPAGVWDFTKEQILKYEDKMADSKRIADNWFGQAAMPMRKAA